MEQQLKFSSKSKCFGILLMLTMFLASSCGLKWEYEDQQLDDGKSGGEVSISGKSKGVGLTKLEFLTPQQPLDSRTRGRVYVKASSGKDLSGITLTLSHAGTGQVIFIGNASAMLGGPASFTIPFTAAGGGNERILDASKRIGRGIVYNASYPQ